MGRAYRDGAELATEPANSRSAMIPDDAVRIVGVWYPGAPEPGPLVVLREYEYRIRPGHSRGRPLWIMERRAVSTLAGDDDENDDDDTGQLEPLR